MKQKDKFAIARKFLKVQMAMAEALGNLPINSDEPEIKASIERVQDESRKTLAVLGYEVMYSTSNRPKLSKIVPMSANEKKLRERRMEILLSEGRTKESAQIILDGEIIESILDEDGDEIRRTNPELFDADGDFIDK